MENFSTISFVNVIKESTIQSLEEIVQKAVFSWEVEQYADQIAEKVTQHLK